MERLEESAQQLPKQPWVPWSAAPARQLWVLRGAWGGRRLQGRKTCGLCSAPPSLPLPIPLREDSSVFPCVLTSFAAFFQLHPKFPDQHRLLDMEVKQHFPGSVLRPSWSLGSALT